MSSGHRSHLGGSTDCTTCHNGTVAVNAGALGDETLHLLGKANVKLAGTAAAMTCGAANKRCTGSCHGENHNSRCR